MAQRKQSISVSLDAEQVEQLDEISATTRIPRSVLVRDAIAAMVEKYKQSMNTNPNRERQL